jgi:hypothetical protein
MERELTPEQKAALEKFGYDKLMDRLKKLLKEQKERHEGGSKWIGTGGTSPFGNGGTNPEGIRIGGAGGNRTAVKVWEQRAYKDYDASANSARATSRSRCAACASFARDRRGRRTGARRHDPRHRQQRRLSRHQDAARAQEQASRC